MRVLPWILVALMLAAPAAFADEPASLADIVTEQRALAAKVERNEIAGLTPRQRSQIRKAQAEVFALSEGKDSLDALSLDDKMRLRNALERIRALLASDSGQADVCERSRKSGTGRLTVRCASQDERDHAREGARSYLERPRVCSPPGCG